jgi:hypothetical protein
MARDVFTEKNVVCPVCKAEFQLRYPNPKLYAASNRDGDRRISSYTWAQGIQTDVVPHYYAVAQCPQCYYADLRECLEDPGFNPKNKYLLEARNRLDIKGVLLLKKITRSVPGGNLDLEGAMALHLAAIFNALLPGKKEHIDQNKLGRLFLRLSWLYREQAGDSTPGENGEKRSDSPTLDRIRHSVEELNNNLLSFANDLHSIRSLTRERAGELGVPAEGEQNPYFSMVGAITAKVSELQTLVEMLQQSVTSDQAGTLTTPGPGMDNAAAGWRSHLAELALKWPEIPRTEEMCLRRAVAAFDYSIKYENTEHSIEQSLSLVNLVVKLLLKLGDLEGALDYISQIFKSGFRDKQELQRRLSAAKQDKTIKNFDERSILRKIATINNTLTQAGEIRKKILGMIYEKHKEKILALLKENIEKTAQEQKQILLENQVNEDLFPYLEEKGLIKTEDSKKKGWFGKKK